MPNIRPSSDLRNNYSEISKLCKEQGEPVFLTVNGKGDTVILSIYEYEKNQAMLEFLQKMAEADEETANGTAFPVEKLFDRFEERIAQLKKGKQK